MSLEIAKKYQSQTGYYNTKAMVDDCPTPPSDEKLFSAGDIVKVGFTYRKSIGHITTVGVVDTVWVTNSTGKHVYRVSTVAGPSCTFGNGDEIELAQGLDRTDLPEQLHRYLDYNDDRYWQKQNSLITWDIINMAKAHNEAIDNALLTEVQEAAEELMDRIRSGFKPSREQKEALVEAGYMHRYIGEGDEHVQGYDVYVLLEQRKPHITLLANANWVLENLK